MAGNQLGKTLARRLRGTAHAPHRQISRDWWEGKRFDHPVVAWVGGVTSEATRDGAERILLGRAGERRGTGTIPKADAIIVTTARQGVADSIATASIAHRLQGAAPRSSSRATTKAVRSGRGDTIDLLWLDEEPPEAIYTRRG